ncbi:MULTISPECIES: hypothetical protein [unclassified Bartonella]
MCNGAGLLLHKRKDDVRCRAVVVGGLLLLFTGVVAKWFWVL